MKFAHKTVASGMFQSSGGKAGGILTPAAAYSVKETCFLGGWCVCVWGVGGGVVWYWLEPWRTPITGEVMGHPSSWQARVQVWPTQGDEAETKNKDVYELSLTIFCCKSTRTPVHWMFSEQSIANYLVAALCVQINLSALNLPNL